MDTLEGFLRTSTWQYSNTSIYACWNKCNSQGLIEDLEETGSQIILSNTYH